MNTIRLAVQTLDPLSHAGLASHIRRRPDLELLPPARIADADVVVVAAPTVNTEIMERLRRLAETTTKARFVLVLDRLADTDLLAAIDIGVAGVLWRADATADNLSRVVLAVGRGGSELPVEVQGRLVTEVATLHRTVLAPRGLTASGLDTREVDVLRFIAEGLDTAEIARKMMYSERTVKGVLHQLMNRLKLRNRAHAVAYAMRAGIL